MKWLTRFLILLIPAQMFAASEPFKNLPAQVKNALQGASTMVNLEGEPSALVNGCVNVITGDYCDSDVDLEIPGAESLVISRSHTSSDIKLPRKIVGPLQNTWHLNYHGKAIFATDGNNQFKNYLTHEEGGGVSTLFEGQYSNNIQTLKLSDEHVKRGMTNAGLGEISARTNRKNSHASCGLFQPSCRVNMSDGRVRHFASSFPNQAQYDLVKEVGTNGNRIVYGYDAKKRLTSLKTVGQTGDQLASAHFSYPRDKSFKKDPHVNLHSNDGRKIRYDFMKKHGRYLLTKVTRTNAPDVHYDYAVTSFDEERIVKKRLPEGRFLEIDYYKQGKNSVGAKKVRVGGVDDWRLNRVRELRAPVAPNGSSHLLYTFQYHQTRDKKHQLVDGITTVCDAVGSKTHYSWDGRHRLKAITKYMNETPYCTDRLFWGADGTSNAGHLISRVLSGGGKAHCCCHYLYDAKGNVLQKQQWGSITGQQDVALEINGAGVPLSNGCETYTETYTYDQKNRKTSETNGRRKILYGYCQDRDLLSHRFICDRDGNIKVRTFYDYDANGVQILEITDDGSGESKDDLADVTQRKIVRISPRTEKPIGLPQVVEELYLDSGSEVLLKKTINHHDTLGRIVREEVYDANDEQAHATQKVYNAYGLVINETDPLGRTIERQFDVNGNKICEKAGGLQVKYNYDRADRHVATIYTLSDGRQLTERTHYDVLGNKIATQDIHENETRFSYDSLGRVVQTHFPDSVKTHVQYNHMNQPVAITDGSGHQLHLAYNIHGKPTRISYPDGAEERFVYSLDGLLLKHVAQNGTTTHRHYDYQGRPTYQVITSIDGDKQERSWIYDAFNLLAETDATGTTNYTYDAAGRLVQQEKNGVIISFEYDALGRKHKTIDDTMVKIQEHDLLDRVIEERDEDFDGVILRRVWYEYDELGNRTAVKVDTGASVAVERYTYDSLGNCISKVNPMGHETRTQISLHQEKRVSTIAPNGVVNEVIYDVLGRVAKTTIMDPYGTHIKTAKNTYDAVGNRVQLEETVTAFGQLVRKITTQWEYDWFGRVVAKMDAVGTPEQKRVSLAYHPNGSKATLTKADGVVVHYCDDGLGRMKRLYSSDGSVDYRYTYDAAGRVVEVEDAVHQTLTQRDYDQHGNVTREHCANGLAMLTEYDSRSRPIRVTLPDHSAVTYAYDCIYLKEIARLNSDGSERYCYSYHDFDRRGKVMVADSLQNTYDIMGRLTSIVTPAWKESIDAYDSVGNITCNTIEDSFGLKTKEYQYDAQRQLVQDGARHYVWDSQYNCVEKDGEACVSNALNQLMSKGERAYQYDVNGNLISNGSKTFVYDALDRLICVETESSEYHYTYDAFNRRIAKNEERYLYLGDNEVGLVDESDRLSQFRVLGIGSGAEIGASVAMELGDRLYRPVHDHAGSVVCLSDWETSEPVQTYRYSAFGELLVENKVGNPWLYSSKRYDVETGFINFGRRYYVPELVRWLTPDPIDRVGGPNVYAYVVNNPLVTLDLYGFVGVNRNHSHYNRSRPINYEQRTRVWGRILRGPGHFVKAVGHHIMPIRSLRNAFGAIGDLLAGHCLHKVLVERKNNKPSINRIIGWESPVPPGYINGIMTDKQAGMNAAQSLSEALGGTEIDLIYDPSEGFIGDLVRMGKLKIGVETATVSMTVKYLRSELKKHENKLMIGFSGGAENLYQAGQRLTLEERSRIIAISVAGARQFMEGDFGRVENFVSRRDLVPFISDLRGLVRQRNSNSLNMLPSSGLPFIDHEYNGPTYSKSRPKIRDVYFDLIRSVN